MTLLKISIIAGVGLFAAFYVVDKINELTLALQFGV